MRGTQESGMTHGFTLKGSSVTFSRTQRAMDKMPWVLHAPAHKKDGLVPHVLSQCRLFNKSEIPREPNTPEVRNIP